MHYTWFLGSVTAGELKILEPQTHDSYRFWLPAALAAIPGELSPNLQNFLEELNQQRITLA